MGRKIISKIGETKYNNFGSIMTIIKFNGQRDIEVYFPQYNYTINAVYSQFKDGTIKCPYEPRLFNVGYIGEGKYKDLCRKINGKHTKCYSTWHDVLRRCYDKKYQDKKPTYIGCTVCEEWHNFQNFAQWYEENYYEVNEEEMHLDKDILVKGNKFYSPSTCIFVPKQINTLFVNCTRKRGDYPIGVSWIKRDKEFRVYCSIYDVISNKSNNIYLGHYQDVNEAFQCYKQFKEKYIKKIADEYKDIIPIKLYEAMYKYKIEITD